MTPTITAEKTSIIRERQFSSEGGDEAVLRALAHIRREGVTGTFLIDIPCGGIGTIRFQEKQCVEFNK